MIFDLVARDRRLDLFDHLFQQCDVEVGHANRARAAFLLQLHQRLEHRGQIHVRRRPVHEIEIDPVKPELLQAGIESAAHRVGRQILVPDLGGNMKVLARHSGIGNRGPDGFLVAIHLRSVDVAIAERERTFHRRAAGVALHAIGAEAKARQVDTLRWQLFHYDQLRRLAALVHAWVQGNDLK